MDTQYGIAVNNKFELFLSDEDLDPLDILRQQEEEKEKKKKEASKKDKQRDTKSAKNKKNKSTLVSIQDQKPKSSDDKENQKNGNARKKKGKVDGVKSGNEGNDQLPKESRDRDREVPPRRRENRDNQERGGLGVSPPSAEFRDRPESGRGRGGRGRGRGGPRGGRGGFDRFGKREFDRHSGSDKTGVRGGDKREGSGAHNWGTWNDDVEEAKKEHMTRTDEAPAEDWANKDEDTENQEPKEKVEGEAEEDGEANESKIEDIKAEMTLDEWRAKQTQNRIKSDFKIRKAGEGCDNAEWKKMYVLKKKAVEEDESEEEYYESDEEDVRRKKHVNIEITFTESPRRGGRGGRRGRGGERGPRGRSGRGGRDGGKRTEPAPNVLDDRDFPSLS